MTAISAVHIVIPLIVMALIVPFTDMTVQEVADAIESLGNHRITITGGEPLLQEAAVVELIDELNRRKL